jgi:hypothetical protein
MARPWIEFVQSQRLPWQPDDLGGARAGVEVKLLSRDDSSGGCSLLVRYPAGFHTAGAALAVDDELFVLDGELVIGVQQLRAYAHAHLPVGAGQKILYRDPVTQDTTWLLGTRPLRWSERSEVHPTAEEMYLLAGEVHGNRGIMRPGAYFWRPPGIAHGPFGTLTGNLYFFRSKGGRLQTTYVPPERPFRWWPPFDPALPAEYERYQGESPGGARCW